MEEVLEVGDADLRRLHRHFINLMCRDAGPLALQRHSGPALYNFSAFVVEVDGLWLAVTAGHIFDELGQAVAGGAVLSDWCIDDSIVTDHRQQAYPIALDIAKDVFHLHVDGMDYGVYPISPLTRMAIESKGIEPVREDRWNSDDFPDFPYWVLVGSPAQFTEGRYGTPIVKRHVAVRVIGQDELPPGFSEERFQRLYAKVDFDTVGGWDGRFNMGGMSGGPVFALKGPPIGDDYDYRLIGIQSSWNNSSHIALCAAQPFLRALAQQAAAAGLNLKS